MTITIELPDEDAALFQIAAESRGQDIETFFVTAAARAANAISIGGNRRVLKEAKGKPRRWSVADFAGVAAGRPGAISSDGTDVDDYINKMRDEWDERDMEIDRPRNAGSR